MNNIVNDNIILKKIRNIQVPFDDKYWSKNSFKHYRRIVECNPYIGMQHIVFNCFFIDFSTILLLPNGNCL